MLTPQKAWKQPKKELPSQWDNSYDNRADTPMEREDEWILFFRLHSLHPPLQRKLPHTARSVHR